MKSRSRDKAEGTLDKVAGRVLEVFSKLTGKRSSGAKGKAARARGSFRSAKGSAKGRARGSAKGRTRGGAKSGSRKR
jgi:uncharacterized protein YjbJ (UPF0337 family)